MTYQVAESRLPTPESRGRSANHCAQRLQGKVETMGKKQTKSLGIFFFFQEIRPDGELKRSLQINIWPKSLCRVWNMHFFHRCRAPIWNRQQFESWNFMFLKRFPEIVVEVGMFQDCNGCFWGTATSEVLRPTLHLWQNPTVVESHPERIDDGLKFHVHFGRGATIKQKQHWDTWFLCSTNLMNSTSTVSLSEWWISCNNGGQCINWSTPCHGNIGYTWISVNTWMAGKKIGNPFYELIHQRTPKNPRKTSKGIDPIVSDIDPAGMFFAGTFHRNWWYEFNRSLEAQQLVDLEGKQEDPIARRV